MATWLDYNFYDKETGEEFFVEIDTSLYATSKEALNEAKRIAKENFENPVFCGTVDPEVADILGLDTY